MGHMLGEMRVDHHNYIQEEVEEVVAEEVGDVTAPLKVEVQDMAAYLGGKRHKQLRYC